MQPKPYSPYFSYFRIFQYAGYILLLSIVILGLLGILGGDTFLKTLANPSHEYQITYPVYNRVTVPFKLRISVPVNLIPGNNLLSLRINMSYIKNMLIKQIYPQPIYQAIADNKMIFYFRIASPANIIFYLEPTTIGFTKASMGWNKTNPIVFEQAILP